MYKIMLIFDSDALIKLIKADLPKRVFDSFSAYVSEEVYEESVIEGKKGLYKESFEIESLITNKKIIKKKSKTYWQAQKILKEHIFGKGEESTVHLFFGIKADAIISDDGKFLNFLFNNHVPFILPSDLITNLYKKGILNNNEAIRVLEGLRHFIKDNHYIKTKNELEAKK